MSKEILEMMPELSIDANFELLKPILKLSIKNTNTYWLLPGYKIITNSIVAKFFGAKDDICSYGLTNHNVWRPEICFVSFNYLNKFQKENRLELVASKLEETNFNLTEYQIFAKEMYGVDDQFDAMNMKQYFTNLKI